jgi:hypothetical protein
VIHDVTEEAARLRSRILAAVPAPAGATEVQMGHEQDNITGAMTYIVHGRRFVEHAVLVRTKNTITYAYSLEEEE